MDCWLGASCVDYCFALCCCVCCNLTILSSTYCVTLLLCVPVLLQDITDWLCFVIVTLPWLCIIYLLYVLLRTSLAGRLPTISRKLIWGSWLRYKWRYVCQENKKRKSNFKQLITYGTINLNVLINNTYISPLKNNLAGCLMYLFFGWN